MSAWPIPDEVVRAFARQTWPAYSDKAPEDDPEAWVACLDNARDFLERHRLVVLPKERVETGVLQIGNDWPGLFVRGDDVAGLLADGAIPDRLRFHAERVHGGHPRHEKHVQRIPGQPIPVDKEERDGE